MELVIVLCHYHFVLNTWVDVKTTQLFSFSLTGLVEEAQILWLFVWLVLKLGLICAVQWGGVLKGIGEVCV